MIAFIKSGDSEEIHLAEYTDKPRAFKAWTTSYGLVMLSSWITVVDELDMTMDEARLVYPEYFV